MFSESHAHKIYTNYFEKWITSTLLGPKQLDTVSANFCWISLHYVTERCHNCQNVVAVLYCEKCEAMMCQQCFSVVHQSRVLSTHKPTYLKDKDKTNSTIELQVR